MAWPPNDVREVAAAFLALVFTIASEKWVSREWVHLEQRAAFPAEWLLLAISPPKRCQIKARPRQSPPHPHPARARDKLCTEEEGIGIKSRLWRNAPPCFGRSREERRGRGEGKYIVCWVQTSLAVEGEGWDTFTHRRSIMNEVSDLSLCLPLLCRRERLIFKKQFPWGRRRRGIEEGVSAQVSGKAVV